MITIVDRKIVGPGGKIEISSPELAEGMEVDIEATVYTNEEMDETEYLLSTEANKKRMYEALEELKHPENLVPFDAEEYEKRPDNS